MEKGMKLQLQSTTTPSTTIPAFLLKLRNLLDDDDTNHLIKWDDEGHSFHLCDQTKFSKEVLPLYFKHNNLASFIRQLNMYGFKKIAAIEHGGLAARDDMEFHNQYFIRDDPLQMEHIKRKNPRAERTISGATTLRDKLSDCGALQPAQVSDVLVDVKEMKAVQDSMSQQLSVIKRENSRLWQDVATLRRMHSRQQQIINKLIQFMMTMAGSSRKMKRTLPMIDIGPSFKKKADPSAFEDAAYTSTSPSDSTIQSNTLPNAGYSVGSSASNGITIRDITDDDNLDDNFDDNEPTEVISVDAIDSTDIPSTVDDVELIIPDDQSNPRTSVSGISNAVVKRPPSTPPLASPMLFKTQLSDNLQDVQSEIDLLKDLFLNSDSLGLPSDALDNIFDGNADSIYTLPSSSNEVDLDSLLMQPTSSEPAASTTLSTPSYTSAALSVPDFDGLMSGLDSAPPDGFTDDTLKDLIYDYPLDEDEEAQSNKPIISSHDLD